MYYKFVVGIKVVDAPFEFKIFGINLTEIGMKPETEDVKVFELATLNTDDNNANTKHTIMPTNDQRFSQSLNMEVTSSESDSLLKFNEIEKRLVRLENAVFSNTVKKD